MTFSLRKAAPGDAPLILDLVKGLAEYEKLSHEVVATLDDVERSLFVDDPKVFALIAEADGIPCGFALYFLNYSSFLGRHGLYLEDIYVLESHRGRGVGKAFLVRLAQIAKDADCGRMEWSVLNWNAPSIAFYESLGANAMDEWTTYRLTGDALDRLAAEGGRG